MITPRVNPVNRTVQVAFASAIAALLVVGGVSYHGMLVSSESERLVRHTQEVLESLRDFLFALERTRQ
jgi:CHASE3 domain sensor protein